MASYDVTVHGAGVFGLSCAWSCLQLGARVQVIDPFGPGAGSSGGVVGALAPHVPENWNEKKAFQFESLIMAEPYWAEIEAVSGMSSGYGRTGRLQPLADAHAVELAHAREATAAELWQGKAHWQVVEATGAPFEPVSPTQLLIHDTLTARMYPASACAALVAAIRAKGGQVVTEGTPQGAVIWATGSAGLEELNKAAGRKVGAPIKGQAAVLAHDAGEVPQVFAGGVHVIPHSNGTVAVGSTSEREFEGLGTDEQLDEVIENARAAVPVLRKAKVIQRWAGLRPRAKTRAPILGAWPGRPGHFVANGGFKIGFGMGPKVGKVMAELVVNGTDTIPEGFHVSALFPVKA